MKLYVTKLLMILLTALFLEGCTQGSKLGGGSLSTSSSSQGTVQASCSFNGQSIASGQSVTAYTAQTVPFGSSCSSVSQSITCNNGSFPLGTFYASCNVAAPLACSFNSQSVASGSSVTAYQSGSVPFGQSCISQSRLCTNGALSGSYSFASCAVGQPASCVFNGQTVASGQSVTAYTAQTVPFGSSCSSVSQSITCTNGSFPSGTYYPSCSVAAPAACTFNGQTIQSGSSVTAYQASTVPFGQSCVSQSRLCTNGALGGSYAFASCTVLPSRSVVIQATASDSAGVSKVEFYVNGALTCTVTAAPYNCSWNVPAGAGVQYQLQTKAYDPQGNVGTSQIVTVTSQ